MRKFLFICFFPFLNFSQTQIGQDIDGESLNDDFGRSVAISSSGTRVVIGANFNDGNGLNNTGHCRVYDLINGNWVQIGQDINGTQLMEQSGYRVDISNDGSKIAVSAPRNAGGGAIGDEQRGCVKVYQYNTTSSTWVQIGQNINGESDDDLSGSSISFSDDGTIIAIGAPYNNGSGSDSGHVRVYSFNGVNWNQIGQDINGTTTYDQFGFSVSLSGDGTKLAIGANMQDGNGQDSGAVKIYSFNSTNWVQIGQTIVGESAFDEFGKSVSLSADGNKIAIGAPFNDGNGQDSGHVRIYEFNGTTWNQLGQDIDGDITNYTLGESVSLSADGNIFVVGAPYYLTGGHAKAYRFQNNAWTQLGVSLNTEGDRDDFGASITITPDGTKFAVGGPTNENNIPNNYTGYVRVFDLSSILKSNDFILENFYISPNPAKDILNISLQKNLQLEKVNIYNNLGQLIKSEKNTFFNVSSFNKGIYFIEVITNKGKVIKSIIIE